MEMANSLVNVTCKIAKVVRVFVIFLFLFGVWTSIAASPLNIEISRSKIKTIPIAIACSGGNLGREVFDIIVADLTNSGQFNNVQDRLVYDEFSAKQAGADYLLMGTVIDRPFSFDVIVQLKDLERDNMILFTQEFTSISKRKKRLVSHLISDQVFHKITGVPGFFATKIAYITVDGLGKKSEYKLFIADADCYQPELILSTKYPIMSPNWSPDNKKLAFVTFKGNKSAIHILDIESKEELLLTKFPGINGAPKWSPDGTKLALVLSKEGAPKIYVYNFITTELQRITHGWSIDTEPAWATDASSLFFTSNLEGNPQIYNYNFAERLVRKITTVGDYNSSPSPTPDGKKLVFLHRTAKDVFNIAVQDLTNAQLNVLYKDRAFEAPSIAPNGTMILYGTKDANKNFKLAAVSLDGNFRIKLPIAGMQLKDPAWSHFR